ncbi:MAG: hypothetical protein J6B85_11175 [Lachnospiraceae bacterium]|nr:hypothetical protein [Lachnospiraceae bacterium]
MNEREWIRNKIKEKDGDEPLYEGDYDRSELLYEGSYEEEPFVVIRTEEQERVIPAFCSSVFANYLSDEQGKSADRTEWDDWKEQVNRLEPPDPVTQGNGVSGKAFLMNFLKRLPKPITIIQEGYHIDRSFRDTYYMYFSNQHFQIKRYSRRLSFFLGEYDAEQFFDTNEGVQEELERHFIGSCVINPLVEGSIGRTLISPHFALAAEQKPAYMRLSSFGVNIYGRAFRVAAFPYRMQDEETMCCAEVTLLNIMEYYSNSYSDYKVVVPSEIIEQEQKHSHERVLPARGVTYPVLTKVLSDFGFSPRLYNVAAIDSFRYSSVSREDELRRWLHYYVESGIPVALNLVPLGIAGTGHSIVCIGHGQAKESLKKEACRKRWISWSEREHAHPLINSADFYDDYVVVDDNQPIYQVRNFRNLSVYSDMRIENLAVPLYKRMFLDAPNAFATIRALLHSEQFGIGEWAGDFLKPRENVIIRIFMASSRSYKSFRMNTLSDMFVKQLYTMIPMPRFIWVCELYRAEDYEQLQAFGEVVIDATSAPNRGHRSLILMHYPGAVAYRNPEQTGVGFEEMAQLEEDSLFPGYQRNLIRIEGDPMDAAVDCGI